MPFFTDTARMCQPPVTLYSRPWSRMRVEVQCHHSYLQRTNPQIWPCNMSLGNDYKVPTGNDYKVPTVNAMPCSEDNLVKALNILPEMEIDNENKL